MQQAAAAAGAANTPNVAANPTARESTRDDQHCSRRAALKRTHVQAFVSNFLHSLEKTVADPILTQRIKETTNRLCDQTHDPATAIKEARRQLGRNNAADLQFTVMAL